MIRPLQLQHARASDESARYWQRTACRQCHRQTGGGHDQRLADWSGDLFQRRLGALQLLTQRSFHLLGGIEARQQATAGRLELAVTAMRLRGQLGERAVETGFTQIADPVRNELRRPEAADTARRPAHAPPVRRLGQDQIPARQ